MRSTGSKFLALSLAVPAAALSLSLGAQEAGEIEEVVITGVRGKPRTVQDSPVPVDVFSSEDLENVEFTDMNDIVRTLVPTYNLSREPISDGASFIRPATLRGLPTDKTLVLVNGKRRHRAALVRIGGSGVQGPDLATIPAAAIGGLEILRDGAAALYGSDAIAGVMNFQLKTNDSGGSLFVTSGEYYEGDGSNTTIGGNIGFSLGDGGFLSISGEHYTADATYRGNQYCGSWFCLDPDGAAYDSFIAGGLPERIAYATDPDFLAATASASLEGDVVQPWGNPNAERTSIFFNAGMPVSETVDFYAFGNYTESESDGSFFYRYPYNGTIEELREPDGSIYFPLEKYPGGFTPRFFGEVEDMSLVAGLTSSAEGALGWDVSVRTGESSIDYTLANTINPSMGPESPTSFKPGTLTNTETQFQVDLSYALSDTLTILGGASYLDEEYDIGEGEADSYRVGPYSASDPWGFCSGDSATAAGQAVIDAGSTLDCSDSDDPVYRAVGVGSNGFPGYSPAFSDVYSRDSFAVYAEVNADVGDSLFVQGAIRYEDYSDFGSETIFKLAGNYSINDSMSLRASYNTGFRAPTPGQQGTTNVSTRLPNGFPVAVGLFPASGIVAQTLGATDLKPETSSGFSIGVTGSVGSADFTIDYYTIDVDDYFNAVSTRDVSSDPTAGDAYSNFLALDAAGVAGANTIGGVNWFTNAYDVGVSGVDAVVTLPIDSDLGTTDITLTYGYNKFEFNSSPDGFLNAEAQHDIANFDPNTRFILQANHRIDNIGVNLRGSYWGEGSNRASSSDDSAIQTFGSIFMTDLSLSYFGDGYTISAGGMNIFDEYPDKDSISDYCCGRIYPSASGISWQGGRWYVKAEYLF
ncbi:MAG: TonB-dependent receptor [Luminiphilus sp.]|jgi:iron complex outermembrane receptor protein|nr:TonB-dependent receptor [Luminiphilus sp.]